MWHPIIRIAWLFSVMLVGIYLVKIYRQYIVELPFISLLKFTDQRPNRRTVQELYLSLAFFFICILVYFTFDQWKSNLFHVSKVPTTILLWWASLAKNQFESESGSKLLICPIFQSGKGSLITGLHHMLIIYSEFCWRVGLTSFDSTSAYNLQLSNYMPFMALFSIFKNTIFINFSCFWCSTK